MTYNPNRQSNIGTRSPTADQGQQPYDQVRDKAGQFADTAQHAAQNALGQVQQLDLNDQIAQRPWLALGAAVAAGYLLGNSMSGGRRREYSYSQPHSRPSSQPFPTTSYSQNAPTYAKQQAEQYESTQREGTISKLGKKMFSKLDSLEDLYHEQLQDLYDAEHQILKALPKMMAAASSPELKRAFELHLQQTQGQIRRLEQIFDQMGHKAQGKTCAAMQGLVAEGNELMGMRADPTVMDAGLIASAQRVEHYEMAGYGCLRTWARQLGHTHAVQLLQQTLDEEEQTDKQLSQIAERAINVKAAQS
jgi:ferritin-like metal-binding protein YciE